jgi:hypothetical protein
LVHGLPILKLLNYHKSQQLCKVCRYDTSLSKGESELVILLRGAKYKTNTELDIHATEAKRAGVAWDVIRSIPWCGDEEL